MGLFSRFKKRKKDSEEREDKTTGDYDESRKNSEKELGFESFYEMGSVNYL